MLLLDRSGLWVILYFYPGGYEVRPYMHDRRFLMRTSLKGLTGNQLKLLALLFMTVDHVGMMLFPQHIGFRIIGRLAMPIFAFMIAEGCRHTRSKVKYLLRMAGVAAVCQLVYFFAMGSLQQSILVTFSLSIGLILLCDLAREKNAWGWLTLGLAAAWFLCRVLPDLIAGFSVDYGIFGVLLPVLVYLGKDRKGRLLHLILGLVVLCLDLGSIQWYCLGAAALLALYNGQRGKARMKHLFYIYYPAHLVIIYLISYLL